MFENNVDGRGAARLGRLGNSLYCGWLELRSFLIGLRIAWVSTASAAAGLVLFCLPQVRDMLLDVRGDTWSFWTFWACFYFVVIFFWVLPVFVSARWILARFEVDANQRWNGEPVPVRVRSLVPAFLVMLCFTAIFLGQLMALGTAPIIKEEELGRIATLETARKDLGSDRQSTSGAFVANLAMVAGANIIGGRSNVPSYGLGIAAFLVFWFYIGGQTTSAVSRSVGLVERYLVAISAYLLIAATVAVAVATWAAVPLLKSSLLRTGLLVCVPLLLVFIWLAWRGAERLLWRLGTAFGAAGAALLLFALFGVMETERDARFGLGPLYLWPFATVAMAAFGWWLIRWQPGGGATRVGRFLLWLVGAKDAPTDRTASATLVNPIFYALLALTALLGICFFLVPPLYLTEPWRLDRPWHLNRALLLPVVLGMLVAALTGLTYLSARWRAPLVFSAILGFVALGMFKTALMGDHYGVEHAKSPLDRPTLEKAVKQWAVANDCDLPQALAEEWAASKPCPAPIVAIASGGASRAAFQVAGVVGKLMDNERWTPLQGHRGDVLSAAFSPGDSKFIVTASLDKTARIWDAKTGVELRLLPGHSGRVNSAAFSRDGKRVVTAGWDGTQGGKRVVTAGWDGTQDGKRVVTAARDWTAKIWDIADLDNIKVRTLRGHTGDVNSATFSPDPEGELIATASDDRTAIIWDAKTGDKLAVLEGHKGLVYSVAFSPNGERVVTGAWDHKAMVWDVPSAQELKEARETKTAKTLEAKLTLEGHSGDVNSAAFSPDPEGKLIATASDDRTAIIWDAKTGHKLAVLKGHKGLVHSVAFSPDGERVVTGAWDHKAMVWDVPSAQELKEARETKTAKTLEAKLTLEGHSGDVNSAAFSADGRSIVTASDDKTARIWDASTGLRKAWEKSLDRRFDKQLFAISSVSGGALGAAMIYAAVADGQARHRGGGNEALKPPCNEEGLHDADWFAAKRKPTRSVGSERSKAFEPSEDPSVSWKACLQVLVAGDFLSPVFVGISRDLLHPLWWFNKMHDRARILESAWTERYAKLTSQGHNKASTLAKQILAIRSGVKETDWLPILLFNGTSVDDGKRIIVSDMRNKKDVVASRVFLDAHDLHDLYSSPETKKGHAAAIFGVAVTLDGSRIITASDDKSARIWDAKTGAELGTLTGHTGRVNSAAFSPDDKQAVTAAWDDTAKTWDVSNPLAPKELKTLKGHKGDLNSAAFSPNGELIVTASDDKTAIIWDAKTGDTLAVLDGHASLVYGAAFSPDSRRVVTAAWDRTAKVWDVSGTQELNAARDAKAPKRIKAKMTLRGHRGDVNSATFSPDPDGELIATASDDETAIIWDGKTGDKLAVLEGHKGLVYSVAFSPNGKRLVTAARDHTAMVWDVPSAQELKEARDTKTTKKITTKMVLKGHAHYVNAAVFSPDGQLIVTASSDKTARIWDAATGKTPVVLKAYKDGASCDDCDIPLSTAVTMSARFPIISPTGNILDRDKQKTIQRVVDGGYHDYLGAVTAAELVKGLEGFGLSPAVIFVNNDPTLPRMECVRPPEPDDKKVAAPTLSLFSLWSPLHAVIETGAARGSHAIVSLCETLGPDRFAFVSVEEDPGRALSMNWWLSKYVQYYLDAQLGDPNKEAFQVISKMRRDIPVKHKGTPASKTITLLDTVKAADR